MLEISVGLSRKATNWKQENISWEHFTDRLRETHRTHETYKQYMAMKRDRQDEIKDVGGFVGGLIKGGNRTAANVVNRWLITLDVDFAHKDFWDDFQLVYGEAACLYSTHKHSGDAPRLRLIMPLDRPVMADEYQAISRRIAGNLGIEYFDQTTFQPERLMYWPSTSADGEYVFAVQEGPVMDPDQVLRSYHDWKDMSQWPMSARFLDSVKRDGKKLGNPLEKPGIVGAFCRTYGMVEGIEKYLGDEYEKITDERYTFKGGSTSGGLVIYDNLFAFSHHGTDPASGICCNIFDLVRLHKFQGQDDDIRPKTPINKWPSHIAMEKLASEDSEVRGTLGLDRQRKIWEAFPDEDIAAAVEDPEWPKLLDVDKKGSVYSTSENIKIILRHDKLLREKFALNEFAHRWQVTGNLPWRKEGASFFQDVDEAGLRNYLAAMYKIDSAPKVQDALQLIFKENGFHPVRDYLQGLTWDGENRVDRLLIDFMGCEDSGYVRAITRKTLVAAITRIFQPGVKFDFVLSLVGPEGRGKSTLFDRLGGNWFSDSFDFTMLGSKESFEQLQGAWIIEIGEMKGLRKAEAEHVKSYISKRIDRFRVAYGRNIEDFARQNIFVGTGNNLHFLVGENGNRRFWPVNIAMREPVRDVFTDLDKAVVDQIWAEAMNLYGSGESIFLSPEMESVAREMQLAHTEEDERMGMVQKYLDTKVPGGWQKLDFRERENFFVDWKELSADDKINIEIDGFIRDQISVAEIWVELMGLNRSQMTKHNTKDLHSIMQNMKGWEPAKYKINCGPYGRCRGYTRKK